MKKVLALAIAAFLVSGVSYAHDGDKKKECSKEKKCCKKDKKKCCKKDEKKTEEKVEDKKA
jgi:hypothetical protein